MKNLMILLILLLSTLHISSQNTLQEGSIRELNSQRKPISGVFIKFESSGSTNSDDNGKFQIIFQNKKAGDLIFLEDFKKSGYELVNRKDFEILRVNNTNKLGVDMVLAKSGVIDAAKKEYYGVSDRSLIANFEKEKQILKNQLEIANINEQEYVALLKNKQEQYDIQHRNLDALSEKFARINFDDVSPIYKEALGLFKLGKISEAISKLESSSPIQRTADIMGEEQRLVDAQSDLDNQKALLIVEKKKQIATVQLLADMYDLNFDMVNAEIQYTQLLKLDSTNLTILNQSSVFYRKYHRYDKAIKLLSKIILHKDAKPWDIATAHANLGRIYFDTRSLKEALKEYQLSFNGFQKLYNEYPNSKIFKTNLFAAHDHLGSINMRVGNIEKAYKYIDDGKNIIEELYILDSLNIDYKEGLAASYQRLGEIEKHIGNYKRALDHFNNYSRLILDMHKLDLSNNSIKNILAISYDKIGSTYNSLKDLPKSLVYYDKALALAKELYEAQPQNADFLEGLVFSYEKLGITHKLLGDLENALINSDNALKLAVELYDSYPQNINFKNRLTISYENLADINAKLGNYEKTLMYYEKALDLAKELLLTYPNQIPFKEGVAIIYTKLGVYFSEQLQEKDDALNNYEKAKKYWKELVEEAPNFPSFKAQLDIVNNTLSKLKN